MKPWGVGVLAEDARIVVNSDGHILTLFGGRNFAFTDKASAHAIKDALNALPEGAIKLLADPCVRSATLLEKAPS